MCCEQSKHKRSLDDILKLQESWEEPPSVIPLLDASSLFDEEVLKPAGIRDVEMEAESEEEESFSDAVLDAKRKAPLGSQNKGLQLSNPVISKWDLQEGSTDAVQPSQCKVQPSEVEDVIRRAQRKRVRWADEQEEVDGFHIQGAGTKLEEIFYVNGLGPGEHEGLYVGKEEEKKPMTFSDLVKAERLAFKLKHLKCALKGSVSE